MSFKQHPTPGNYAALADVIRERLHEASTIREGFSALGVSLTAGLRDAFPNIDENERLALAVVAFYSGADFVLKKLIDASGGDEGIAQAMLSGFMEEIDEFQKVTTGEKR